MKVSREYALLVDFSNIKLSYTTKLYNKCVKKKMKLNKINNN